MYQALSTGERTARPQSPKRWRIVVLVAVAFMLFVLKRQHDNAMAHVDKPVHPSKLRTKIQQIWPVRNRHKKWVNLPALRDFWIDLSYALENSKPTNPAPQHSDQPPSILIDGADQYTLEMSKGEIETMRLAHLEFVNRMSTISLQNTYQAGTHGIVTTAGGKYIPIFLVSLRMLRRTGSTVPVEVFLANDEEYDAQLCEKVLPPLNARCRVLSHVLSAAGNMTISSYQFKVFALLFSSFEDNLFIDADNLVVDDPRPLLTSEPYSSTGMVLWPDFWPSTVSPIFYEIQGREKPTTHLSKTSETGQILISKRIHARTLLLSAYYNLYGPDYYYSLLSQGAPGEGDKETFSVAADFVGMPYYQVKAEVGALGFFDIDNESEFMGGAMMQYNPSIDADVIDRKQPKPSFVHANTPKFDPNSILEQGLTKWKNGESHRMWNEDIKENLRFSWGPDPERAVFEEMIVVACQDHSKFSTHIVPVACRNLRQHYIEVFGVLPGRIANI